MAGRQRPQLIEEPTEQDRAEISALTEAKDPDFARDFIRYLATGDESGRRVFRSRELATRSLDAARRILADAQARARSTTGQARSAAQKMEQLVAAELKVLIPITKVVRMEAADMGPRREAERLLGEIHLDQLRFLMTRKAEGMTGAEAVAALKEALESGEGRVGRRAQANDLLGKLLKSERDHLIGLLGRGVDRDEALKAVETLLARRFGGPGDEREVHP